MQELLRRASLEHAGAERASPEEDSFWVEDLILKLELDPILQNTHAHDNESIQGAWIDFTLKI